MPEQSSLQHASGEGDDGPPEDKSESDVEASDIESAEGFRVSVDLSAYWCAPAACLVWVPRATGCRRRVRWLARRVRRAAQLQRPFCLLCGARALPPTEPLRMLRTGDQLRVVPVEHEWQQAFSFPADASSSGPEGLPELTKKKQKSSQREPEKPVTPASSEPTRKHKSSRGEPEPTPASSESIKKQKSFQVEPGPASPELREAKKKRRRRNTLMDASPPHAFETSEMQTDPITPAVFVPELESNEALEHVKLRALALLQQVEGAWGADEPDGGGLQAPTKKRRRRVRRRRAPGPLQPPLDPLETSLSPSEPSSVPGGSSTSRLSLPAAPVAPSPGHSASSPASPASPARCPSPAVLRDPSPAVLRDPSPAVLRDPSPAVLRNPTPPRPPRLVRPLPAASAEDFHNTTEPQRAPSPQPAPAPPAVQCN